MAKIVLSLGIQVFCMHEVKALRQFGVLVLLLVSCLAPAMACMVPNAAMSTQERACCRMNVVSLLTATVVLTTTFSACGQTPVESTPTPLSQLLAEGGANNPQISAADHGAQAAKQMAPQVTTLPDPKFTYQQLSVGSP